MTAQLQDDSSFFDRIASLLPAEQREHFYRRMTLLQHLGPNDEILQIAEAMGFLALITRQIPAQVAGERLKLETLFNQTLATLKIANETTLACQCDLDQRLRDLAPAIAVALNPENLAAVLSETLRQQFRQTGLPVVADTIGLHTETLRQATDQFTKTLEGFSHPESGALIRVNTALTCMQANLDNAANHVRRLSHALVKDLHRALAIVCFGAMVIGFLLGLYFTQWLGCRQ